MTLGHLSVQFSCSVMSDCLQPRGLQHARFPCPSPTPGACSNSCPLSGWCHPAIPSSVVPFSSCLQYFPASGLFQVAQVLELQLQHQFFQWISRTDFLYGWLVWCPAVQGTLKSLLQCHKNSIEPLGELEIVRIELVEDFIVEHMLAAKFPHPLYCTLGSVLINIVGM